MKNKQQLRDSTPEMKSVNENIYDMFSIAELEERLQMSALFWGCGTNCSTVCATVCACDGNEGCGGNCPADGPCRVDSCSPVAQP
jgi:hypothetical protein